MLPNFQVYLSVLRRSAGSSTRCPTYFAWDNFEL
jgi:hypothetical protein